MKGGKKTARRCLLLTLAAVLLGVFLWCENHCLAVSQIEIRADISQGIRVLHLSDLHGAWFGKDQARIAKLARDAEPDVIVITGDFIDARHDEKAAAALIRPDIFTYFNV